MLAMHLFKKLFVTGVVDIVKWLFHAYTLYFRSVCDCHMFCAKKTFSKWSNSDIYRTGMIISIMKLVWMKGYEDCMICNILQAFRFYASNLRHKRFMIYLYRFLTLYLFNLKLIIIFCLLFHEIFYAFCVFKHLHDDRFHGPLLTERLKF